MTFVFVLLFGLCLLAGIIAIASATIPGVAHYAVMLMNAPYMFLLLFASVALHVLTKICGGARFLPPEAVPKGLSWRALPVLAPTRLGQRIGLLCCAVDERMAALVDPWLPVHDARWMRSFVKAQRARFNGATWDEVEAIEKGARR